MTRMKLKSFLRVHCHDEDPDSGLSLIELVVASSIFIIITITVLTIIANFESVQKTVSSNTQASSSQMITFNRVALDIRNAAIPTGTAGPIIYNSPSQLEIYTTNDLGSPITVCMIVQTTGSTTSTTCPSSTATTACPCTLSEYIVGTPNALRYSVDNLTSANIFTYLPPPPNSGSTIAIESVQLYATIQPYANQPSTTVQNTIEMRNVALTS